MKFSIPIISLLFIALLILPSCEKNDQNEIIDSGPKVIYEDSFDGSSFYESESIKHYEKDSKLYIEYFNNDPDFVYYYYYYYDFVRNYIIETSIDPFENPENFSYGIMFLHKNLHNHYYIYIRQNEYYIGYVYNFNYHTLKDYTYSEHINIASENIIKIYKGDKHLKFWINDHLIFETDINFETGDQFGYKLKQAGKVAIDYFKVYEAD